MTTYRDVQLLKIEENLMHHHFSHKQGGTRRLRKNSINYQTLLQIFDDYVIHIQDWSILFLSPIFDSKADIYLHLLRLVGGHDQDIQSQTSDQSIGEEIFSLISFV